MLSFMGRFRELETTPFVFERQATGEINIFTLWLICISYLRSSPSVDIVSCRMTMKSTSGVLYNAYNCIAKPGALKKHEFHLSFKQRGVFVEHFQETQASRGLLL